MPYNKLKIGVVVASIVFLLVAGNIFSFSILQIISETRDLESSTSRAKEANTPTIQEYLKPKIKSHLIIPQPTPKSPTVTPTPQPIYVAPLPHMRTSAS